MENTSMTSKMLFTVLAATALPYAQNNVLTAEEAGSGYIQLFNGNDLSNWKTYNSTSAPSSWTVQTDGGAKAIVVSAGGQAHLISKQNDFQNFDLKVEWKVPPSGNSGIFIRYKEIDAWGGASGPEAQVVDVNHPDGQQAKHRAGTCYDLFPLIAGRDNWWNPTNQWNQFRIIAFNSKIAHYGNGKKILEYDMSSTAFNDAYLNSKYRTYPEYKTIHAGAIYLQHHGETGIKYRDMRIKKLTSNPWAAGSPYVKADGTLIDDMTFAVNIFATPTIAAPFQNAENEGMRFLRQPGGMSVLFPDFGEYTVRLSNLQGRTQSMHVVRGDRWTVPAGQAGAASVLRVSKGSQTIHHGVLPAF